MKENTNYAVRRHDAVRTNKFINREVSPVKAVLEGVAIVALFVVWVMVCCA